MDDYFHGFGLKMTQGGRISAKIRFKVMPQEVRWHGIVVGHESADRKAL